MSLFGMELCCCFGKINKDENTVHLCPIIILGKLGINYMTPALTS